MIARLCRWYIVKVIGNLLTNQFQRPLVCILSLWKIHQCLLKFTMTFFPTKRIIKDLISQIIYSNVCIRCLHFYVEWIHKHEVLSWNWNSYVQHMIAKTHCIYSTVLVFPMINRFLPKTEGIRSTSKPCTFPWKFISYYKVLTCLLFDLPNRLSAVIVYVSTSGCVYCTGPMETAGYLKQVGKYCNLLRKPCPQ